MRNLICLIVFNEHGILSRIINLLVSKNFNILTFSLNDTETVNVCRIFLEISGSKYEIDQIIKHLSKLLYVLEVKKMDTENFVERQLMIVKIFSSNLKTPNLLEIASIFSANIINISENYLLFEICGNSEKIENFQKILKNYGNLKIIKSGKIFLEKEKF